MGSFNDVCEGDIFKKGKQLNLYPHYAVISFLLKEEPNQRRRMKLLEIGCGPGNNLWMTARKGYQVYGIDGSKSALKFSRNQFVQDGLIGEVRPILTTRV